MKNILIIEDDPFTIDFYKFIFKKAGYNALITEEGDKIISFLSENQVHLIIMDINLKNTYLSGEKMDGVRLSKKLKEDENFSEIPILLVTAYSQSINGKDLCKTCQAADYITKPIVDFNFLIDKVNKLVR